MTLGSPLTSRSNARVKQLRAAFRRQARISGGLVAIEGDNLVGEALRSGIVLETVFLSEDRELPGMVPRGVQTLWLNREVFAGVVETRSPQGIAALIVPPAHSLRAVMVGTPLVLVAAGVQDPGNMGTLVRSAEAFGATGVLTTEGTVSAWNQKALRASAGSVFRMPIVNVSWHDLLDLRRHGLRLMAAVADGPGSTSIQHVTFLGGVAILIGNEGAGLSDDMLSLADVRVTIPCPGAVESLNAAVAGSLLLYEASRQRAAAKGVR